MNRRAPLLPIRGYPTFILWPPRALRPLTHHAGRILDRSTALRRPPRRRPPPPGVPSRRRESRPNVGPISGGPNEQPTKDLVQRSCAHQGGEQSEVFQVDRTHRRTSGRRNEQEAHPRTETLRSVVNASNRTPCWVRYLPCIRNVAVSTAFVTQGAHGIFSIRERGSAAVDTAQTARSPDSCSTSNTFPVSVRHTIGNAAQRRGFLVAPWTRVGRSGEVAT